MKLQGKKLVVLGGTSGIGLAVARGAIGEGASVVVVSSSKAKVAAAAAALGPEAEGQVANLGEERQVAELFGRIGAFDHLAYTAGDTLRLGELAGIELAAARHAYELRLFGALAAVKHAAPHIRSGGSIVLTTGIAGARPQKGWSVAASVCSAMEGLTRALAVELGSIRVNLREPWRWCERCCGPTSPKPSARRCSAKRGPGCRWAAWASPRISPKATST